MSVNRADAIKIQYYSMLLKLLTIGIPYDAIKEMDEEEIVYILATNAALEERK